MDDKGRQLPFYQDIDGFRMNGLCLPDAFRGALKYKPQEGELYIATYPKCGTTWVQQIVFLLFNKGQPTENPNEFWSRMPFIEMLGVESVEQMVKPGAIKTHLPFKLTPYSQEAKYIHVVRNPKDALVSFFHHTRTPGYKFQDGDFNVYFDLFMAGETDYGDYFDHVLGWYEHRDDPNMLFVVYEELKKDPRSGIKKIAKFMGKEYENMLEDDPKIVENVVAHSSLDYMKTIFNMTIHELAEKFKQSGQDIESMPLLPAMKHMFKCYFEIQRDPNQKSTFIRKGIIGDWRNAFSEDQNRRMNEKIEAKLGGTELYSYWKSIDCL